MIYALMALLGDAFASALKRVIPLMLLVEMQ